MNIQERIKRAARGVDGNVAYMGQAAWGDLNMSLRAIDLVLASDILPDHWTSLRLHVGDRIVACTPSHDLKPHEIKVGPAPK